jgi:hypothetical protein
MTDLDKMADEAAAKIKLGTSITVEEAFAEWRFVPTKDGQPHDLTKIKSEVEV